MIKLKFNFYFNAFYIHIIMLNFLKNHSNILITVSEEDVVVFASDTQSLL